MKALDLISHDIPFLSNDDDVRSALHLMQQHAVFQLPVVEGRIYAGLVDKKDLSEVPDKKDYLKDLDLPKSKTAILSEAYFFDAAKVFSNFHLSVLPVVEMEDQYQGVITASNLVAAFAQFDEIRKEGGIIILEIPHRDYMLSEISRLAESNDLTIVGIHTIYREAPDLMEVVVKTNRLGIGPFIGDLQQMGYRVVHHFDEEQNMEDLRLNYENLMNYLNM